MTDIKPNHEVFDELVDRALSGVLPPADATRLEQHLASCAECRTVHDLVSRAASAWQAAADETLDDSVREEVGDRLMGQILLEEMSRVAVRPRGKWRRRVAFAAAGGLAAAAVALVALSTTSWQTSAPGASAAVVANAPPKVPQQPAQPVPAERGTVMAQVVAMEGRGVLTHADGSGPKPLARGSAIASLSTVSLEPNARMRVRLAGVSDFVLTSGAVVALELRQTETTLDVKRGRLTAEVHKRLPGELFTVRTPAGAVEITGTVFEVEVQPNGLAQVAVAEGTVIVRDTADPRNVVAVRDGERLSIDWADPRIEPLKDAESRRMLTLMGSKDETASPPELRSPAPAPKKLDPEALFGEAEALRKQGQHREALRIYERLVDQTRGTAHHAEALFASAQLLFLMEDYEACARYLEANLGALRGTPYHTMALSYLAKSKAKIGQ